jgi:hypothetical protein
LIAATSSQIHEAADVCRSHGTENGMRKRVSTLFSWIEAHEAQRLAERAILARGEGEREAPARDAKTPAPKPAAPMQGVRSRLAQMRAALLGRSGRTT